MHSNLDKNNVTYDSAASPMLRRAITANSPDKFSSTTKKPIDYKKKVEKPEVFSKIQRAYKTLKQRKENE
jgi:hypothetical protein